VGKTTSVREIARLLSEECRKRVVIIDTSNEIGGDGDIPHPGIGRARRMQARAASRPPAADPAAAVMAAGTAGRRSARACLPVCWGQSCLVHSSLPDCVVRLKQTSEQRDLVASLSAPLFDGRAHMLSLVPDRRYG